jgi:hypothetical protein
MPAYRFNIGYEVLRRILAKFGGGSAFSGTSLVEKYNSIY